MNESLLQLYYRLPYQLRSVVATCRGFQLRSMRYGPETERLVAEAIEREHWSVERWKRWQEERLAFVLHRAAKQVPYYREQWAARRVRGDKASWEYLENWPILEKERIRENANAFVADDCNVRRMFLEHTSGTTGKPLSLWKSRETMRALYALSEVRERRWHGVSKQDRWAMLGGQLITPIADRQPPFWVWNKALNQLYMSSYHLSSDLIPHYLDALKCYSIRYIWGYTSSLYALAQDALRLNYRLRMSVAITNAEPVFEHQRRAISEAFQCPVRETYGMSENVALATECENNRLHLSPEVGFVEVLEHDQPVVRGVEGDLVLTGLLNADMPLIRYRVGDRGILPDTDVTCECGRTLPHMASIQGRIDDVLYTADGRRIGRLDPVFKADLPIHSAQIIQESLERLRVRYVATPQFNTSAADLLIRLLRERMGDVAVVLEPVDEIPRTSNGKIRAVICQLPPDVRRSFNGGN